MILKSRKKASSIFILVFCMLVSSCNNSTSSSGSGDGTDPNGFSRMLGPTFKSPRCTNCHGFDTGNAIAQAHAERPRNCAQCHSTPGWEAPFRSFSFSGISTSDICESIKNKSGGDLERLKSGLVNSTLSRWALEDSQVFSRRLGTAPPGSVARLSAILDQWIAAGASCN